MKRALHDLTLHAALVAGALLTLAPLAWMVSASLMPTGEANTAPPRLWPSAPTLAHYVELFTRLNLARSLLNSTAVALTTTLASVLINGMAGYAFAKLRFRGRDRVFQALLAALVVPAQVVMLPLFLELRALGLVNTLWGAMVPGLASVFGIFMVRQYALAVPDDLLDAARIDGAGEFTIYSRIILPLSGPALATLAVFHFMYNWNDFLWPLLITSSTAMRTLPAGLALFVGAHVVEYGVVVAGAVLALAPLLVAFLFAQRYFIQGIAMTGLKD